jgi:hypothetical protein
LPTPPNFQHKQHGQVENVSDDETPTSHTPHNIATEEYPKTLETFMEPNTSIDIPTGKQQTSAT